LKVFLSWFVRLCVKPVLAPRFSPAAQRRWANLMAKTLMPAFGTRSQRARQAGVEVTVIRPTRAATRRGVLYLHGGGYVVGGPASHGRLAGHLARVAQAEVRLVDYRLAPEHPHPAAIEDVMAVYRQWLAEGMRPADISWVGDSAGGGLGLATAVALRDAGLPLPDALVLMSPWVDLGLGGASVATHAARDPLASAAWLRQCAACYRGAHAARSPLCSPLFAKLNGLPRTLVQVGSEEILLSDAERIVAALRRDGVAVELQQYPGMWHVFQLHVGVLQESDAALVDIRNFICGA